MARRRPTVRVFKDKAGEYRWHFKQPNGRITASSAGDGYTRKRDATRAAGRFIELISGEIPRLVVDD